MTTHQEILSFFDIKIDHFSDKSARWLFQDKENVRGLIEILANELSERIDFNQLKQINRSFIPNTLREQESDIVYSVPIKHESKTDEILIYILIEHQSTVDITMGFRVLFYMTQIWDWQRRDYESDNTPKSKWRFRPILPIVYYTGSRQWKTPLTLDTIMDVPQGFDPFIPKFDIISLNIKDTEDEVLTKTGHPLGWLLTVLKKEETSTETLGNILVEALSNIKSLSDEYSHQKQRAVIYFLLLILHRRPAEDHENLISLINKSTPNMEVQTMAKSMADVLKEQGIEQGEIQAKQQAALKLINIKFDDVPNDVSNKITSITDILRLDLLFEKAATAQTLDEIDLTFYDD